MPKFLLTSKDSLGRTQSTTMEGTDKNAVVAAVQARGLYVVNIQVVDEPLDADADESAASSRKPRKFTHNGVSLQDIVIFSRQLATMLEAGVPLLRSLYVVAEQVESRVFFHVLEEIKNEVQQGQAFSKALEKHPKVFSAFWVSLVEVGEASGTMPKILKKLTDYMEEAAKFQSQLVGAMIYPGVLMTIGFGAVLCFALFIGPTFKKIFSDMNMELPGITVMMLSLFDFLKTKFYLVILGVVGVFFSLKAYYKTPAGRWQIEMFLFAIPVFGNVIRLIIVEKFTSQMAILIESGVPILYALEISERLVDNMVCGAVIRDVRDSVKEGKLLADSMDVSSFFPSMSVQMIRVGEETGELSKMLGHVARFYKGQVEDFMKNISTLIEPVMLVFMGAVIGLLVVSMFLPLLTLSTGG